MKYQGFLRVMTRSAGRVRGFSKCHGSSLVGRVIVFLNLTGRVGSRSVLAGRIGSGQEVLKSRGSGRVGSRGFEISRVGSGHDPRDTGHSRVKPS